MSGLSFWNILLALLLGYLIGSFPSGLIFSRLFGGKDPRMVGSGHTGATNVFRNVNRVTGVLTALADVGKGALAVWLALQLTPSPWVVPLAGAAAVAGHCWPIFAQFRGGMGLATAAGLALWFFPLLIPIFAVFYFMLQRFVRHQARSIMLLSALIPTILLALRVDTPKLVLGAALSVVLIIRWASDFHRVYE